MNQKKEQILFVGFNQDYGCFTCGTSSGFRIFNSFPFKDTFHREFDGGIGIVEMLYRTNIIALVGGGESPKYPPNKVMLWDDSQMKCIGELNFKSDIRAVKLRKDKVIVVLEWKIYVYNFQNLRMIEVIETSPNPKGLIAVSPSKEVCVLASPDKNVGTIRVLHFDKGQKTFMIQAHQSPIAALTLNNDGNLLATASDKGTLIRVFDTETTSLLQELRRGSDTAEIFCIAFDFLSKYIASSSDKGTIHIFSLRNDVQLSAQTLQKNNFIENSDQQQNPQQDQQQIPQNSINQPINEVKDNTQNTKSMLSFMKGVLGKYFDSEWSFAQLRLIDSHSVCAIKDNKIIAISEDGNYYLGEIEKNGGECKKVQQKALLGIGDE